MTYSIVARDPETGQLGAAVQSHYFSTGSIVTWAQPGAGAVATQAMGEASYGPLGLHLMATGVSAPDALRGLLAADDGAPTRQVAMIDREGAVATHTGATCIADAGHRTGVGYSVQANMMRQATVWDAMASAYETASGPFADRLLAALDAGEAEGGDLRGRQSAAIVIAPATGSPWARVMDLRVEDHADPLVELRRLVEMRGAYDTGADGPAMGDNPELAFWQGIGLAARGQIEEARALLARAYRADPGWALLLERLPATGLLADDAELIAQLLPE